LISFSTSTTLSVVASALSPLLLSTETDAFFPPLLLGGGGTMSEWFVSILLLVLLSFVEVSLFEERTFEDGKLADCSATLGVEALELRWCLVDVDSSVSLSQGGSLEPLISRGFSSCSSIMFSLSIAALPPPLPPALPEDRVCLVLLEAEGPVAELDELPVG
jgi:hypothetical protein